jgi:myo-inositol-1(or 4)-monophosphatase
MVSHSGLITVMQRAARKAAPRLRRDFGEVEQLQVSRKGPGDFVSMADKRSEQTIVEELRTARPDWGMLLEEGGEIAGNPDKPRWIVDPLDGTTNFLHGYPAYAVSIAAAVDGVLQVGVVHHVPRDQVFWAARGAGAWCGDQRLQVSPITSPEHALIGTGFPFKDLTRLEEYQRQFARVAARTTGIRRAGSAAIDLTDVAAGRFEGFWEQQLSAWDVAAGTLLIREAGGVVTNHEGRELGISHGSVVAGNPAIHRWLLETIRDGT